jgi:uncharacterized protein (TIGR02246 family)
MKLTAFTCSLSIVIAGVLLLAPACQQQVPDTRAADELALREVEAEWSKANAAKDIDKVAALYTDDAVNLPANEPAERGKEAIKAGLKKLFAKPSYTPSGQVTRVEVARSGDLGITHGTYSDTWNDAKGKPLSDQGKWITVYRKQADGKWRCILNIGNSDLPSPPK